jgi:hypothetical protein
MLTDDDPGRLEQALRKPLPCLLCGQRAAYNGLFTPKAQAAIGVPPDKVLTCRYSLCRRCYRKPKALQQVKAILLGDLPPEARTN